MSYSEKLATRIREALADIKKVEEKKMFRGVCFMVKDKMCVCVSGEEMMCRIGPEKYEEAIEKTGTRPMIMRGKTMKGFLFVSQDAIRSKKEFDYWIDLCLGFNDKARSSKTKAKKKTK
jgi:TfoX/Sxy family transcriptional regulator of competence genes